MNAHANIKSIAAPRFDLALAQKQVELLTGDADERVWFRMIHDKVRSRKAHMLFGTIKECWPQIVELQAEGYGAFIVVNEGGNNDKEITTVRAFFMDGDNIPLPDKWHREPDLIVRRDKLHWHAYFLSYTVPVERFEEIQKRLIAHYGTDPAVCNPSRVMRLAGSVHQKGEPTPITLEDLTDGIPPSLRDRSIADIVTDLPELPATDARKATQTMADDRLTSPAIIKEMLQHISPSLPRDKGWLAVCGAMVSAPVDDPDWYETGREIFTQWSRGDFHGGVQPRTFEGVDDCAGQWQRDWEKSADEIPYLAMVKLANSGGFNGHAFVGPKYAPEFLAKVSAEDFAPQEPVSEEPTAGQWVEAINQKHAIVRHGGEALVARSETDPQTSFEKISFMGVPAFKTLHQNKYVRSRSSTDENGEEKKEPRRNAGKVWLDSPDRREYPDGVVFAPARELPPTYLNLYRGWHVTPADGHWSLLQEHIRDNVCQGNKALFHYVIGWLASAVRNLDTPLGVALVLRGGQGVGKGILGRAFGHLFGPHFVQLAKADQILGRFNAALRDALLVFGDEAFYAADPRHDGALKALITEPLIAIEEKFRDPLMRANSIRLLLATNNDWAVPADADDRRFAVLDVGSGRRGDKAYFAAIYDQLKHRGYGAMLYDLLERDLGAFDVRDIPDTKARAEQKTNSLKGPVAWLHDVLQRGRIGSCPWEEKGCLVDKGEAYSLYAEWSQQQREYRPATLAAFGRAISRALGAAVRSARYRTEDHISGPRQFEFSSLIQCRAAFAGFLKTGQSIWEDASNED